MEGSLHVDAVWDGASVSSVSVRSFRMLQAGRLAIGQTPQQAAGLLPMLFGICKRAQGVAASMATEAAAGIDAPEAVQTARRLQVQGETMLEHLWRILHDWMILAKLPSGMQAIARMRALLDEALSSANDACHGFEAGRLHCLLSEFLHREVFGCEPLHWLELDTRHALQDWCESVDAPAAKILNALAACGRFGSSSIALMPEPDATWLREASQAISLDADFAQQPHFRGSALETGALARQQHSPLLSSLMREEGNTVFVRAAARLTELANLASGGEYAAWAGALQLGRNEGISWVQCARGLLMHRVVTDGARVLDYRIVAPTEWNFHADGALVQGLRGMTAADGESVRNMAEWLVQSLDPCVACRVTVRDARTISEAQEA